MKRTKEWKISVKKRAMNFLECSSEHDDSTNFYTVLKDDLQRKCCRARSIKTRDTHKQPQTKLGTHCVYHFEPVNKFYEDDLLITGHFFPTQFLSFVYSSGQAFKRCTTKKDEKRIVWKRERERETERMLSFMRESERNSVTEKMEGVARDNR